jgi:nicotinamide-nucleotide amidase
MIDPLHRELALRLGDSLQRARLKLATAESCTGGGLSCALTSIPGSSRWFERGFVTYSDDSKRELLGVGAETLEMFGAVSEQVATAMAMGALANSRAEVSVAITGIAGPEGGTITKPVGTVCLAWARRGSATRSTRVQLPGERDAVRDQSISLALQGLLDLVESGS